MKTIETSVEIERGGRLKLDMPVNMPPGRYKVVVVVDETSVNELDELLLNFPVDDLGVWPENLSLRREDMYGDNER